MNIYYSDLFAKKIKQLPREIKTKVRKKLDLLLDNPHHPSLRTKKIQSQNNLFETSITMNIRLTWQYSTDGIILRNIGAHDKTLKNP